MKAGCAAGCDGRGTASRKHVCDPKTRATLSQPAATRRRATKRRSVNVLSIAAPDHLYIGRRAIREGGKGSIRLRGCVLAVAGPSYRCKRGLRARGEKRCRRRRRCRRGVGNRRHALGPAARNSIIARSKALGKQPAETRG